MRLRKIFFIFAIAAIFVYAGGSESWGSSKLTIVHNNSTDEIAATVCDIAAGNCISVGLSMPGMPAASYSLPNVTWKAEISGWEIIGTRLYGNAISVWMGTITKAANGQYIFRLLSDTMKFSPLANRVLPSDLEEYTLIVADEKTAACSSWTYGEWGTCGNNQQTRAATGSPAGCTGSPDQPVWRSCAQCTGYDYSGWGTCANNTQTRTILGYTPSGCSGSPTTQPSLSQTCTSCTDYIYSAYGTCTNGNQSRTITGYTPAGCSGTPSTAAVLTQTCTTTPCTDYVYSSWGTCTNNSQSRSISGYTPAGCSGTPSTAAVLTQSCTVTVACTDYTYSAWGTCTNNSQSRTVTGYLPAGCSGTPSTQAALTQACGTTGAGTLLTQNVPLTGQSVTAGSPKNYYFDHQTSPPYIKVYMLTSDWSNDANMIVSTGADPAPCSAITGTVSNGPTYWYRLSLGSSNETVSIPTPAPGRIYVTVCNSASNTALYQIYWAESY